MKNVTFLWLVICFFLFVGNVKSSIFENDDNFSVTITEEGITSFKQNNSQATIRNLASFIEDLYQKRLSQKIQHGLPLSKEDVHLLKMVIDNNISVVYAFALSFYTDILNGKGDTRTERQLLAPYLDRNVTPPPVLAVSTHLFVEFRDGRQDRLLRNLIKEYAKYFKSLDEKDIKGDVWCVIKQVNQPFDLHPLKGKIWLLNPASKMEDYEDPNLRPYKKMYPDPADFVMEAENIGKKWEETYSIVSHYIKQLRRIYREISGYNKVAIDQKSRQLIEDLIINEKEGITNSLKNANMNLVDLPFIFLTKYAFVSIQGRKAPFKDNEQGMEIIAGAYAAAVHGNAMLNEIASSHAANCYVQLIQLLKSELGGEKPGSKFKRFMEQSKLYEIDPSDFRNSDYRSRSGD